MFLVVALLVLTTSFTYAQQEIIVYGTAQKTVEADRIYLSITLQEVEDGSNIVDMKALEADFMSVLAKIGLDGNKMIIDNVSAYPSYNKVGSTLASKTIILELTSSDQLKAILSQSNELRINALSILYYSNTEYSKHLQEVKLMALEDAKKQAQLLAEASGNKLGVLLSLEETTDYNRNRYYSGYDTQGLGMEEEDSELKNINIYYNIKAKYAMSPE